MAGELGLVGIVVLDENGAQRRARVRRELKRVGWLRFIDVAAMRLYYRFRLAASDSRWLDDAVARMHTRYGHAPELPQLRVADANDPAVVEFLERLAPDIVLARCKQLLKRRVFRVPRRGSWVLHPGICPQYRNAHGCFWALAQRDLERVGVTLLRIDAGIDTGPIYGYFRYAYDEARESHIVIQYRTVYENLSPIAERLRAVAAGAARPIESGGEEGALWGQPWLSRYLRWKRAVA
jgi:hypothetical protein